MKIVIFGAGSIGRSLVGQLFSTSGYEVVFVDVVDKIVNALNEQRRYMVEVKDLHPETILVENVRAVHGKHTREVAQELATADILATAVGSNNLPRIYENIAQGLIERRRLLDKSIDIIICENIRDASRVFREGLLGFLPKDYPLDLKVGLVETSIGKMVPIMTEEQITRDPLLLFAEAYNTLIVDKRGFKGEIPKVKNLEAKDNMVAYVDLKIFVHNLGHAVTAYLGNITDPYMKYIWEAIAQENVQEAVQKAMWQSGEALISQYPNEFNHNSMEEHIDDLVHRFSNKALGDTIYRVGRDIPRKLARSDRLIGALLLCAEHEISSFHIAMGAAAAILFRGQDEKGDIHEKDRIFAEVFYPLGIDYVLTKICGLKLEEDQGIISEIKEAYEFIVRAPNKWFLWSRLRTQDATTNLT